MIANSDKKLGRTQTGKMKIDTGEQNDVITDEFSLAAIQLATECLAFGGTLALLSYFQAEENFETKDSYVSLVDIPATNWSGLWEPLIREFFKIYLCCWDP